MQNTKRTLNQALQILTAAALALVVFFVWIKVKPPESTSAPTEQVRTVTLLDKGWQFHKGDSSEVWEDVTIPHDWAIYGPFSRDNDLQTVAADGRCSPERRGDRHGQDRTHGRSAIRRGRLV